MEDKLLPLKRGRPLTDENGEFVRLMTEKPPAHCILKIDSFSVLQDASIFESNEDYINSKEFSVGGYTWVLSVYPKGNKLEQGDEHLSLYVTLVDKLAFGSFVDVVLRFFLYDQLRDNYLSVLDVREKRFHALKDTWGVPKFLPIATFNDANSGFLIDDCCVFGAEVLVVNNQVNISNVSIVRKNCVRSYTWRIENFSTLKDHVYSPVFFFDGWSWELSLFARGHKNKKGESLSLYLRLDTKLTDGNKMYVEFILYLKNQRQGNDHQKHAYKWLTASEVSWGYPAFFSLESLHDSSNGYLLDDTIIIEVCIKNMFMLKDMESVSQERV